MNELATCVEIVDHHEYLDPVFDWFGIDWSHFEGLVLTRPNNKTLNIVNADCAPPVEPAPVSIGMPFLRVNMHYNKLTTSGVYFIGDRATANFVDVDRARADAYLRRERIELSPEDIEECDPRGGYVIMRCEGWTIGLGLLGTRSAPPSVKSFQPKAWSIEDDATAFGR